MNQKTLGQFLAELRKEKGLTQRELAEMLNVSDKTVSHWERDESSPDISLLVTIADIFTITTDELLKREKNSSFGSSFISPVSENSMKEEEKIKVSDSFSTPEERFRRYRLLSLLGTAFGVFTLLSTVFSGTFMMEFFGRYTAFEVAEIFPLLSALKPFVISLIATVGARIYFSHTFIPKEESDENLYIYKANRIFALNIYILFAALIFGVAPIFSFVPPIALVLVAAALTVLIIVATDIMLKAKGFLSAGNKKIFRLRIFTLIISSLFIFSGVGFQVFCKLYSPTVETLIFTDLEEFKEYMETPNPKPEDAYRVDGSSITIMHSSQEITPSESRGLQTLYDSEGNKILTFEWLNGDVHNFVHRYTIGSATKINVTTYEEDLKPVYWKEFQGKVIMFMFLYYPAVVGLSSIVYIKKAKSFRKSENE